MKPFSLLSKAALLGGAATLFSAGLLPSAKAAPDAPAASSVPPAAADPSMLIATVDGEKITLGDVQHAIATLPAQARQLQPNMIVPLVVDQLIEQKAIQIAANKEGLEKKPEIQSAMTTAANNALQNAYLEQKVAPTITETALKDYYKSHYVNKKPEEEIHARHILVDSEVRARDIIRQLNKGADFGKLAARVSKDKGSAGANGGDLGWFKKSDMIPDFSKAAFSMKPGAISQTPVHTQYGWHVIQVLGKRTAPIPSFEEVQNSIRRDMIREEVRKIVQKAVGQVKVVHYDAKGKPLPASNASK